MEKMNVLVTSAGTASAISVIKALRKQDEYPLRITAVDADQYAPGLYMADRRERVPWVKDSDYVETIKEVCKAHRIGFLIPTLDREIEFFADKQDEFSDMRVRTLIPSAEVVIRCNDKKGMAKRVSSLGIDTPALRDPRDLYEEQKFPMIVKGNNGNSGGMVIRDMADLGYAAFKYPFHLFQEFVEGTEYTADILCNRHSEMVVCSPRIRLATRAGVCTKGETVKDESIRTLCESICRNIGFVGPGNVQFIKSNGRYFFIDFNPRYAAGGLMLTVMAGANIPLMSIQLMMGRRFSVPSIQPNLIMTRYWEEIML